MGGRVRHRIGGSVSRGKSGSGGRPATRQLGGGSVDRPAADVDRAHRHRLAPAGQVKIKRTRSTIEVGGAITPIFVGAYIIAQR